MVALVGCQPVATVPKPARGGTAVEALVGAAGVLNPLFESVDTTRDVDSVIYQGLTTVDAQQNIVGQLASDWTVSQDHLTYTFNIRAGVKWADGQPFTADDVLFTYHVLQDLEYTQPGADFWRQVGVGPGGAGQVVFTLRAPSASFPLALRIGIIAKHIFAGMAPAQIAVPAHSRWALSASWRSRSTAIHTPTRSRISTTLCCAPTLPPIRSPRFARWDRVWQTW